MKVFFAVSLLVSLGAAAIPFSWSSCGTSNYVTVKKINVSPSPLTFPGKVNYDAEIEIKKPIKNVQMQLKIVRNTFFLDITLPCAKQIGSCTYPRMCSFVKDMVNENWGDIGAKVGNQILAKNPEAAKVDLCATGVEPAIIKSSGSVDIPELPSILKFIAAGDYTVRLEFTNTEDGSNIACMEAKASMEKGGGGWGKRSRRYRA